MVSSAYTLDVATSSATKCRYKTGKCTNERSSKRNGQPHMLCLYHRDKANKIQRKFDRQKRQSVRMKKSSAAPTTAASAFANSIATSANTTFTGLLTHDLDLSSDSDSSRFSTDSDSSRYSTDSDAGAIASLDLVWSDLSFTPPLAPPPTTSCASNVVRSHLSHEELDFLYSAMLE